MMYEKWGSLLGETFEIVQLELPGRGLRFKEKNLDTMEELTEDLLLRLDRLTGGEDYILLGFCYGAVVAYALYQRMCLTNYSNTPKGVVLISSLPPGLHSKAERVFEMSNFKIVKMLLGVFSFNPLVAKEGEMDILKTMLEIVNPEVAEEMRRMSIIQLVMGFLFPNYSKSGNCQRVLKIMKEDGRIMYNYNGAEQKVIFTQPVLAIHGNTDNVVSLENMQGWRDYCSGDFQLEEVKGGHLMIFDSDSDFMDILKKRLNSIVENIKLGGPENAR